MNTILKSFVATEGVRSKDSTPLKRFVEKWKKELKQNPSQHSPYYIFSLKTTFLEKDGELLSFAKMKGKDGAIVKFFLSCKQLLLFLVVKKAIPVIPTSAAPNQTQSEHLRNEELVVFDSLDRRINVALLPSALSVVMGSELPNFMDGADKGKQREEAAIIICPKSFFFDALMSENLVQALTYLKASIQFDKVNMIYSIRELRGLLIAIFNKIPSVSSSFLTEDVVALLFDLSVILHKTDCMSRILTWIHCIGNEKTRKILFQLIGFVPLQEWMRAMLERILPNCFKCYHHINEAAELVKELLTHLISAQIGLILFKVMIDQLLVFGPPSISRSVLFYRDWIFHHPLLINIVKLLIYSQDTAKLNLSRELLMNYGNDYSFPCPLSSLLKEPELWELFLLTMGTISSHQPCFKQELNQWIVHLLKVRILKLMTSPRPDLQQPYCFKYVDFLEVQELTILEFFRSNEVTKSFIFQHYEDAYFLAKRLSEWKPGISHYSVNTSLKVFADHFIVEVEKTLYYFYFSLSLTEKCDEEIHEFEEKLLHPVLTLLECVPSSKVTGMSTSLPIHQNYY